MLGIGKWKGEISTVVLKGTVFFDIDCNNGVYSVDIRLPSPMNGVKIIFDEIHEEGNSLVGTGSISVMKNKTVETKITFEEDGRVKAFMKIPMLGKVVMKNIVKEPLNKSQHTL